MSDSYNLDNQIQKYELSLWTHKDEFLGLLKGQISFDGEAQDVRFKLNINGTKTLSFSIPLYVHNRETGEFISNYLWSFIFNEQKIRLIRNKGEDSEQIYDFIIKNFVETREGDHKFANVECKDYSLYELSKVGYTASLNEDTLENTNGTISTANLNFWVKQVLLHSKNFNSNIVDNYSGTKIYRRGEFSKNATTGFVYRSLKDDNQNNVLPVEPITSNNYWLKVQELNTTGWTYTPLTLYEENNITGYIYGTVPEYSALTTYKSGEYVRSIAGTNIYKSLEFDNLGNALTDTNHWEFVQTIATTGTSIWKPVTAAAIERERIIKIEKSNVYNMLQELAEKFQVWVEMVYTYNSIYQVIGRTIQFKEEVLLDTELSFRYGVNNNSITRTTNSDDIVTKMFVANVEDQFDMGDGYLNIDDAPQNKMMEPFLYNFDYYYNSGQMPFSQYLNAITLEGEVRTQNIKLRKEQANQFNKQQQIDDLVVQQELARAKWTGATETKITLQNQLTTIDPALQKKLNYMGVVVPVTGETYNFKVNLSTFKGIIPSSFTNFKKSNNTTTFTITSANYLYDTTDPTRIVGLKFSTNPDIIATTNVTTVNGSTTATVGSKTGLYVGLTILGHTKLPSGTTIKAISATTNQITLSAAATGAATVSCTFTRYRIYFDFDYNPYVYQEKLIAEWAAIEEGFEGQYNDLITQLNTRQSELDTIEDNINLIRETKENLIYTFEKNNYSFIKEGNWQDTKYVLKKNKVIKTGAGANVSLTNYTREEYYYPNESGNLSTSFNAYYYSTNLNDIDFNSVQIWTKSGNTYLHCYTKYVDYKLEYGKYNSTNVFLIAPVYGTPFYTAGALSNVFIKYKKISDGLYAESAVALPYVACNIYKRIITFTEQNIVPGSIAIYSRYDANYLEDKSKTTLLIDGTDYLLSTAYNLTTYELTTQAILKVSQNALLLSQYPRIEVETNDSVKFFFNDAYEVLKRSSVPKVSYDVNVIDLSILLGYENFIPYVGQKAHIVDTELFPNASIPFGLYGFISEIQYDLDNPENTNIVISNYKTKFEDIFQRIVATTESVNAREGMFETVNAMITPQRVLNFDVLQDSLLQNYLELSTGVENSVVWNSSGITLTDVSGDNPVPGQVRLIGNGIFLSRTTSGGFREWTTAITANGINASAMTTGLLNTKNVIIWNEDQQRFLWNGEGLFAYNEDAAGATDFNSFVRLNHEGLLFQRLLDAGTASEYLETPIALTWSGLNISGQRGAININSTYGLQVFDSLSQERIQIGRLYNGTAATTTFGIRLRDEAGTITLETNDLGKLWLKDSLTVGNDGFSTVGLYGGGLVDSEIGIWAGDSFINRATAPFRVTYSGLLHATGATISGAITATSGSITGALTVGAGTMKIGSDVNGTNDGLYIGSSTDFIYDTGAFQLGGAQGITFTPGGNVNFGTNVVISGSISATSGDIAGWLLSATEIYKGAGATKIALNSDLAKIYIGAGNYINTDTSFYVDSLGYFSLKNKLMFNGSALIIDGTVRSNAGYFGTETNGVSIGATGLSVVGTGTIASGKVIIKNDRIIINNASDVLQATLGFNGTSYGIFTVSGNIAGWTLSATEIYKGAGSAKIALNSGAIPKIYIGAGNWANADTSFYADSDTKFSLGSKLYYNTEALTISGTLNASTFQTSPTTGNGSTAGVIIDAVSARFYNSSSATPLTTISTVDGTLSGTNVNLSGTISSAVFQSGTSGWQISANGNAEFENITARGALKSSVFVYDEINAQGGSLIITDSGSTYEAQTITPTIGSTLALKIKRHYIGQPATFEAGDTLKIKTHIATGTIVVLWLKVNVGGVDTSNASYITYTTTVQTNTSPITQYTLPSGTAVVNYGQNGTGLIVLRADDSVDDYGPYIDVLTNIDTDIYDSTTQKVQVRLGNLSGITDSTTFGGQLSGYGLYAQNAYLTGTLALPSAGMTNAGTDIATDIRIWAGNSFANRATAPFRVQQDGTMILRGNGADQMTFNPSAGTITFGPGVALGWSSIIDPPTIPDVYDVIIYGNHITNGSSNTTLAVKVYKNGTDITASITDGTKIKWYKNGVEQTPNGTIDTHIFTAAEIETSAQISCTYTP